MAEECGCCGAEMLSARKRRCPAWPREASAPEQRRNAACQQRARQPACSHMGLWRHLERFGTTSRGQCQPLAHRGHGGTARKHGAALCCSAK